MNPFASEMVAREQARAEHAELEQRLTQRALDRMRQVLVGPRPAARPDVCARAASMLPRLKHLLEQGDADGAIDVLRSMGRVLR